MSLDDDRAALQQLQRDWMQAVEDRDMERLEEIVAPGFRFTAIHLNPEPMTREQWMEAAREGYTIVSFAYESMDVDIHGDTAVVHSRYSQIASLHQTSLCERLPAHRRVEPDRRALAGRRPPQLDSELERHLTVGAC